MTFLLPSTPAPCARDGTPTNTTWYRGAWYVDLVEPMSKRAHAHIYEDVGLSAYFRCKVCGKCQERSSR